MTPELKQQIIDALEEAKTYDDGEGKWNRNAAALAALRAEPVTESKMVTPYIAQEHFDRAFPTPTTAMPKDGEYKLYAIKEKQ